MNRQTFPRIEIFERGEACLGGIRITVMGIRPRPPAAPLEPKQINAEERRRLEAADASKRKTE